FSVLALLRHDQSEFETFTVSAATSLFGSKPPKPTGIWRLAIEKARALRFSDVRSHPDSGLPKDLTVGPLLLLPLIRESEVIGILAVGRAAGAEPFDEHDNELLAQLAEHVLLAVQYVPYLRRIIGRGARGEKSRRTLEAALDLRSAAGRGSGRK